MIEELKKYNTGKMFCIFCLYMIAFMYIQHLFLINDQLYYNSLSDQLTYDRIEKMLAFQKKWSWLGYCFLPVIYAIKFLLIGSCLLVGSIFVKHKLKFSEAFKIALLSDIVFIIPMLLKVGWFLFFHKDYNLDDVQRFSPLSMINLFDYKNLSVLWVYPLQSLNLFEVLYIFVLGFWIYKFGAKNYEKGLNLALSTYLPGLVIWIVTVMFLTISLNPKI